MSAKLKKEHSVITLLTLAVFVLAFLLSGRIWFRLDLTQSKMYSVSEVTQNLYREMSDELRITYFVSDRLALSHPAPRSIADLIKEYAAHSRSRIRFTQRDPVKAGVHQYIEELGIFPWHIQIIENNEMVTASVYSGILIEYLDRHDVIPLVFSLETLEYNLSSRLRSLVRNESREVGIIIADIDKQWENDFTLFARELFFSGFKERLIILGEEIPDSLPALFIFGGAEDLEDHHLQRIDTYIQNGGRALFAVDGIFVDARETLDAWALEGNGLFAMLANYGVIVHSALVLDSEALTLPSRSQIYPHWISVQREGINPLHRVTESLARVDLYWASPLELVHPATVEADVLLSTSSEAWLQTDNFITNPDDPALYDHADSQRQNETPSSPMVLAAALSGFFPSAFAHYTMDENTDQMPEQNHPSRTSRIIVVGNSSFATDIMQLGQSEASNLDFLIRSAQWLSGNEDLLTIRARQLPQSLDAIVDHEQRLFAMTFSRVVNTVLMPLAVALTGFIVLVRRSRKLRRGKHEL